MSDDIKKGDTVRVTGLRHSSRCPHMVVTNVHFQSQRVTTFWFDRKFKLQTAVFELAEIEKVDLP